jgi:hypothetical protein
LQDALVRGFHHYFYWQVAVVAVVTVLLLGAHTHWCDQPATCKGER